ncbi:MAG: hypothetical protein HY905_27995 [Deltaproteobacteria bacterium]|nr:hypothetical protein [Deltaproteobacteria bacterium]
MAHVSRLLVVVLALAVPSAARADHDDGEPHLAVDPDGFYWLARAQAQLLVLGSAGTFGDDFGGLELQYNAALASIGVALGLRYDHLLVPHSSEGRTLHGGEVDFAIQWRPLMLSDRRAAYMYADLHGDLGFIAGGLRDDNGDSLWRGAVYAGAGFDLPITLFVVPFDEADEPHIPLAMDLQLVLTVQYRYMIVQSPGDAPVHELLVGAGLRGVG